MDDVTGFEGFPQKLLTYTARTTEALKRGLKRRRPEPISPGSFTPKMPKIPRLESYNVDSHPDEYWKTWPYNPLPNKVESWIKPKRLIRRAKRMKFPKLDWVKRIAKSLTTGVDLGFRGAGRLPGEGKNAKSLIEKGYRAYDAVARWVDQKLVSGPLKRDQLPRDIRVSPAGGQDKPTGRVRVTVNMSHPHLAEPDIWSSSVPCSPNASVDKSLYSTASATSADVVKSLHREGPEGFISKVDWADGELSHYLLTVLMITNHSLQAYPNPP